ncbi:MAG: hypothetical protein V4513_08815 [Pseudomonadota bacterium]
MSILWIALVAAQAANAQAPAAPVQPLHLTCTGGGTANKNVTDTIHERKRVDGPPGSKPTYKDETKTVTRAVKQDFADQVDVELFSGDDKIRIPRMLMPDFHGGKAGWFKLKGLTGDERSIRASVGLAFLSNSRIFIDRVTGTISINGDSGSYSGDCRPVDVNAPPKF